MKMEKEIEKIIFYKMKFLNNARIMGSTLSKFFDNLSEGIHKTKCNFGHDEKNVRIVELNIRIVTVFLKIQTLKMI